MNESGNFVFEGIVRPGESEKQYIVDDCLPKGFDECGGTLPEQHYWYVIGDTYYYNTTLTAFSFKTQKNFNLTNVDPNIIFAGIENGWDVSLQSVKWKDATYPKGYTGDLRGGRDGDGDDDLKPLSGTDTYKFTLQVGDSDEDKWEKVMPRSTTTDEQIVSQTWTPYKNGNTNPRFNVHLLDNVNNCPQDQEEKYFNAHLSVPEKVQMIIQARKKDGKTDIHGNPTYETKTYNVTLQIIYIQGPSFTGNVNIMNCALPGERIGFNSKDIQIKTTDQLPISGFSWKLVPLKTDSPYSWDDDHSIEIPASYYNTTAEGYLQGSIPALYSQNNWNIYYEFYAGGETFPVTPTTVDTKPLNERMLVVHNYHKMADIVKNYNVSLATGSDIYDKALKSGAKIYLADAYDAAAFVSYVNAGNTGAGLNFYLQKDLTLTAAITKEFAGTLHGNGYSITLPTKDGSLFADNLTGNVYNLGVPNGTIATVPDVYTSGITNSFDTNDSSDALRYGKKAYDLSHYYTTENDEGNYVHTLYANNDGMGGDWRYARVADIYENARFLRTGAPNYGNMQTNHNTEHAGDYSITEHDCLFFGQTLNPTAEKKYPEHIDETYSVNKWVETNRVFETEGYYRSGADQKFYYNTAAWALQPSLTAVRFDNTKSSTEGEQRVPTSFGSSSADDTEKVLGFQHVTHNLLVYEADNATTADGSANFHHVKGSKGSLTPSETHSAYTCANLALVDKEEFWAPYSFTATKASYTREPANYAKKGNDAWEGICLPFTTTNVSLSEGIKRHQDTGGNAMIYALDNETGNYNLRPVVEGETQSDITFFWGEPTEEMLSNPKTNDRTLNHEFWLRSLTAVDGSKNPVEATFQRPETYTFSDNTPYIVSFPGERYYEFDMTGKTITFSSGVTVIPVTSDIKTTVNGYSHTGTFLHVSDAPYGIKEIEGTGTRFSKDVNAVLPFRTYMAAEASPAKSSFILISSAAEERFVPSVYQEEELEPGDTDVVGERAFNVYTIGGEIVINANYDGSVPIYDATGKVVRVVTFISGVNHYSGFADGLYIVAGKKIAVSYR